jgi:TRAP-type mannitol/chloroaromatic compound transport system permease small subunit
MFSILVKSAIIFLMSFFVFIIFMFWLSVQNGKKAVEISNKKLDEVQYVIDWRKL